MSVKYSITANCNNKFVSADQVHPSDVYVVGNRDAAGIWEQFSIEVHAPSHISLKASNDKYVTIDFEEDSKLVGEATSTEGGATFSVTWIDPEMIALRGSNGKFVICNDNTGLVLKAIQPDLTEDCYFKLTKL